MSVSDGTAAQAALFQGRHFRLDLCVVFCRSFTLLYIVTVRTVKAACVEYTVEESRSGNDEVQLMPAMGSCVFP